MDARPEFSGSDDSTDRHDDVELLVRIADRERDQDDAEAAFRIFFNRHSEFLRQACLKYSYSHPAFGEKDVVLRVMAEVYQGRAIFTPPEDPDSEVVRRHLRKWLINVARNQFHHQMRKLRFDRVLVPLNEEIDGEVTPPAYEDDESAPPPPYLRTRILHFRDSLNDIDRLIFERSIDYYDPVTRAFNVPPVVAQSIAAETGRNVAAVRKRRERIMIRLRQELASG